MKKLFVCVLIVFGSYSRAQDAHDDESSATMADANIIVESQFEPEQEQPTPRGPRLMYKTDIGLFSRKRPITGKVNKACESFYKSRASKPLIKRFVKNHHINTAELEKPLTSYKTFNDFFIRTLKPGSRVINDNPSSIASIADSRLTAIQNISQTQSFMIKNTIFTLNNFLDDDALAQEYEDGTLLIFRLAPEDYHHFHFPCDCIPSAPRVIKGLYDSVNPVVYKAGFQPLSTNQRHVITLETDRFSKVLMIPVGALCVGKIVETFVPGKSYKKGDDAGYFEFGASTVALLFKKNSITVASNLIKATEAHKEVPVHVGEAVAYTQQRQARPQKV